MTENLADKAQNFLFVSREKFKAQKFLFITKWNKYFQRFPYSSK